MLLLFWKNLEPTGVRPSTAYYSDHNGGRSVGYTSNQQRDPKPVYIGVGVGERIYRVEVEQ